MPNTTRAAINISTLVAKADPIEPSTNRMAPAIRLYLRPRRNDSQPLNSAPIAAPSIMLLTTHSCKRLVSTKWSVMNGNAPAITPISRPNNNPATAAATETNIFIRRVSRKERGVKADSVLIVTIFSCQQRVRHSEKIREQLTQVSGRK